MHATHTIPHVSSRGRHREGLPLLPAARRLPGLLQPALRPPAAAAPLLHPHRGRGHGRDRRAPRHPADPQPGSDPARVTLRTRLVASLLGAGGRPDRTSRFRLPVRKIYTQLFSPSSATVQPAVLQVLPAPGRHPGGDPAALLRGHRQPRPGDRPAGRGRGDDPAALTGRNGNRRGRRPGRSTAAPLACAKARVKPPGSTTARTYSSSRTSIGPPCIAAAPVAARHVTRVPSRSSRALMAVAVRLWVM